MSEARTTTRLLPWVSPDGKTCFLVSDESNDGVGLSRVADRIEAVQLDMADGLLDHADDLLDDGTATERELRFLGAQLSAALRDVRRVAESRGARLSGQPDRDGHEVERGGGGPQVLGGDSPGGR